MLASDPLLAAVRLLRPRLPRLLLGIALGVLSLGSALALAGLSAWLITRAWQMPPVLDLSIAVVAVRTFAISRGVLHYCERLASPRHRVAGRGHRPRADLLPTGTRSCRCRDSITTAGSWSHESAQMSISWPMCWSAPCCRSASRPCWRWRRPRSSGLSHRSAAAILAICLLVAGILAPWLASRAAAAQEVLARQHHSARDVSAMLALEHAPELRVGGRLPSIVAESQRRQRDWGDAIDAAARPAAFAEPFPRRRSESACWAPWWPQLGWRARSHPPRWPS